MKKYKFSKETRKKMSESHKGKKHSKETKEKIRLSKIGNKNPAKRPGVRAKISKSKLKKLKSNYKKLTPELGYILGTVLGDGSLEKDNISLTCKDLDFIEQFRKCINIQFGFIKSTKNDSNGYLRFRYCSKIAVNFLKNFNLNKLIISDNEIRTSFLRGMYDSEGSVIGYNIMLYNTNKKLLEFCKFLLLDLSIKSNIGISRRGNGINTKDCFVLKIHRKDNLIKFRDLIGFSIKRKQERIEKRINSYLTPKELDFLWHLAPKDKRGGIWRNKFDERYKNKVIK